MKVIVVFDASTSLQKEAQRDKLSDQLEVVFSAGGEPRYAAPPWFCCAALISSACDNANRSAQATARRTNSLSRK